MKIEMITKIHPKPDVQAMLVALRKVPVFNVEKTATGYEARTKKGILLFKATLAEQCYKVDHAKDLFKGGN